MNCHEGEIEKHWFALVMLLDYLLGLLNINMTSETTESSES